MNDLMWGDTTLRIHDDLQRRGVSDPESGELYEIERIDWAVQEAVENFNSRENARITDLGEPRNYHAVVEDICRALGIEYDELTEVLSS